MEQPCVLHLSLLHRSPSVSLERTSFTSTALVAPIYKKGNKSNPVNYRPISLTCIPCKMVEYIVLISHIWKHINANNVIFHHQHESQTGISCQTQLMEAVRDWVSSVNNHKQTYILLLDFSKASDRTYRCPQIVS
jgi:hypothetical protein